MLQEFCGMGPSSLDLNEIIDVSDHEPEQLEPMFTIPESNTAPASSTQDSPLLFELVDEEIQVDPSPVQE